MNTGNTLKDNAKDSFGRSWARGLAATVSRAALIGGLAVAVSACQYFGGPREVNLPEALTHSEGVPSAARTQEEYEERLAQKVQDMIAEAAARGEDAEARVRYSSPYYFQEFLTFPGGLDSVHTDILPRQSRTVPYTATVRVPAVRHSTRLHRFRETAEADQPVFRDVGYKTLSYEVRNAQWVRQSAMFFSERTEVYADGQWQTASGRVVRTIPEQEAMAEGWFRRTIRGITGR